MGIVIFCDGGSRGNPGPAASAFVVQEGNKVIYEEKKFLGIATNNFAEYSAVILALTWLQKNKISEATFNLDSQLVVMQILGKFKVKSENISKLFVQVKSLQQTLETKLHFNYVPRTKNFLADALVNESLDEN